jgi:hypothetical protein
MADNSEKPEGFQLSLIPPPEKVRKELARASREKEALVVLLRVSEKAYQNLPEPEQKP